MVTEASGWKRGGKDRSGFLQQTASSHARTHPHPPARPPARTHSSAPLHSASDFAPPALELPAGQALHDGGFGAVELPPGDHVPCGRAGNRGTVSMPIKPSCLPHCAELLRPGGSTVVLYGGASGAGRSTTGFGGPRAALMSDLSAGAASGARRARPADDHCEDISKGKGESAPSSDLACRHISTPKKTSVPCALLTVAGGGCRRPRRSCGVQPRVVALRAVGLAHGGVATR